MTLRRATGKSSKLVIFLRWFSITTALVYIPFMCDSPGLSDTGGADVYAAVAGA